NKQSRVPWLYLGFASITALTAGKLGSNTNHFLEWTAATSIVSAIVLSHLVASANGLAKPLTLGLAIMMAAYTWIGSRYAQLPSIQSDSCRDSYSFLRSYPGDRVLSENVAALVLNNKPVLVSNPFVVTQLKDSVDWQAGTLEELTRRQYFQLILLTD